MLFRSISLDELLALEPLFKSRCIDAINSGAALLQYGGLNFLWMLSQLDEELVKHIKETLVTDNILLAKVISYCTSRGKTTVRLVVETRHVNKETLSEFIDVEEAYSRIDVFVTTREFLLLPKETQKDVIAFLIAMASNKKGSPTEGLVAEEIIQEELQKRVNAIQRMEV